MTDRVVSARELLKAMGFAVVVSTAGAVAFHSLGYTATFGHLFAFWSGAAGMAGHVWLFCGGRS